MSGTTQATSRRRPGGGLCGGSSQTESASAQAMRCWSPGRSGARGWPPTCLHRGPSPLRQPDPTLVVDRLGFGSIHPADRRWHGRPTWIVIRARSVAYAGRTGDARTLVQTDLEPCSRTGIVTLRWNAVARWPVVCGGCGGEAMSAGYGLVLAAFCQSQSRRRPLASPLFSRESGLFVERHFAVHDIQNPALPQHRFAAPHVDLQCLDLR